MRLGRDREAMISVIVPAVGNVALTRRCVESLRLHSTGPVEVVLVDNGSTEEESAALADLGAEQYIELAKMVGFPAAVNRGVAEATGEWVCLLNNDARVLTHGWDLRLIETLTAYQGQVVSPVVDFIANPAQRLGTAAGRVCEAPVLFFVCVVLRRKLFLALDGLDERFGLGNSEDEDFCIRLRQAGGRLLVDPAVFVNHLGHATFRQVPGFGELLATNRQVLRDKHDSIES